MNQLTNEERAKVFAMYYGQRIVVMMDGNEHKGAPVHNALALFVTGMLDIEKHGLLLKPLSSISDEDAVEVAKIISGLNKGEFVVHRNNGVFWMYIREKLTDREVRIFLEKGTFCYCRVSSHSVTTIDGNYFAAFQYLISKGYAVPLFFGVNHWANGMDAIQLKIAIENK